MKRLYLLRHAQAEPSHIQGDHARNLTDTGRIDALNVGVYMAEMKYTPDMIFCSDATRTKQTCEGVADALSIENHQISYESSLYESHYDDYLKTIRNASNDKKSTMIIGHNPVIHGLAVQIAKDDGNKFYNRLMCLYPPASLSVFDLPIEKWSDLKLSDNTLVDFRTV